jgi:hypothetical protein
LAFSREEGLVVVGRVVEAGNSSGSTTGFAWQLRLRQHLLGVGARANVRHLAHNTVQDPLRDDTEEPVAGHLPGMEVDVCLSAPGSWELSYNMRSK